MSSSKIVLSDAAVTDILEQFDWYADHAGSRIAKRWEKSVASTLLRIATRPGLGAPCNFRAEQLRGTRRMGLAGFPKHLIFYQIHERTALILRVVHGARDLVSLFS